MAPYRWITVIHFKINSLLFCIFNRSFMNVFSITFWVLVIYPNDKIPESMKEKSDYLRFQRRLRGEDHGDDHHGSHH